MWHRIVMRPAIGTLTLLLVPLVLTVMDRARPEGEGWHWGPLDFVAMAALLFGAGVSFELIARRFTSRPRRVALGLALAGGVLAVWVELAVGGISQCLRYLGG